MNETSKALAAYLEYEAMGPTRSLVKLLDQIRQNGGEVTVRLRTLEKWSSKYDWQKRVKIYDEQVLTEEAKEKRKKREEQIDRMNEEHIIIGRAQMIRALKYIEKLISDDKFSSQAAVALFKYATDLQRIAAGHATKQIEVTGKDGAPIEVSGSIAIYLPKKDEPL